MHQLLLAADAVVDVGTRNQQCLVVPTALVTCRKKKREKPEYDARERGQKTTVQRQTCVRGEGLPRRQNVELTPTNERPCKSTRRTSCEMLGRRTRKYKHNTIVARLRSGKGRRLHAGDHERAARARCWVPLVFLRKHCHGEEAH